MTTTRPLTRTARMLLWAAAASYFFNGGAALLCSLNGDTGGLVFALAKILATGLAMNFLINRTTIFQE